MMTQPPMSKNFTGDKIRVYDYDTESEQQPSELKRTFYKTEGGKTSQKCT